MPNLSSSKGKKKPGALFLLHQRGCPRLATTSCGKGVVLLEQEYMFSSMKKYSIPIVALCVHFVLKLIKIAFLTSKA